MNGDNTPPSAAYADVKARALARGTHDGDAMAIIERELASDPALASPHTQRTYTAALRRFEAWRGGQTMTKTLIERYAVHLRGHGLAASTVNHHLSVCRWWARRLADLAAESPDLSPERRAEIVSQAERAARAKGVRGESAPAGRHVPYGEVHALLQACESDGGPIGRRDGAMIALGHAAGLRRSELVGLDLDDVTMLPDGTPELRIRGKGGKTRPVAINDGAAAWLGVWLALRGDGPGPLFQAMQKSGGIVGGRLSAQAAQDRLTLRADEAGVSHLTWHDLRRTLAGDLLSDGSDLALVQRVLGHRNINTTSMYDRRPEDAKRQALRRRHTPRPRGV